MANEPTMISPRPELMTNPDYHTGDGLTVDIEKEIKRLFDYQICSDRLKTLINDWKPLQAATEHRRKFRNIEVDIEQMQKDGRLKEDETLAPMRAIDENIRKEKPNYINFLKQSRRLCIFADEQTPENNTERLEQDFTKKNTYIDWDKPHQRILDGTQLHGWDQVEREYDSSKPGMVAVSHIGHENLLFQLNAHDLEDCEEVLRKFSLTVQKFESFSTRHNFDPVQAAKILSKAKEDRDVYKDIIIYKRFHKYEDIVWVSWFADPHDQTEVTDWLRAPRKLFLGVKEQIRNPEYIPLPIEGGITGGPPPMIWQDVYESSYPIDQFFYAYTEEPRIIDHKGRYFLDKEKQEIHTALWSIYINGAVRASSIYASPEQDGPDSNNIEKLDLVLEPLCFYSRAMKFWSPPYPSSDLLKAANALDVKSSSEQGDIASAVINREDARKTAKEISYAEEQKISLSSIGVGNYSTFVTKVYSGIWRIQQSLAAQGIIPMVVDPMTGENDINILSRKYIVKASGDVDVVMRQEKLAKRFQAWSLVAMTPIKDIFMLDILTEMFPEDAPKYQQALQIGQAKDQAIAMLSKILFAALLGDDGKLRPEFQEFAPQLQQLQQFLQQGAMAEQGRLAGGGQKVA